MKRNKGIPPRPNTFNELGRITRKRIPLRPTPSERKFRRDHAPLTTKKAPTDIESNCGAKKRQESKSLSTIPIQQNFPDKRIMPKKP